MKYCFKIFPNFHESFETFKHARLSWPSRQLLSARKSTVAYHNSSLVVSIEAIACAHNTDTTRLYIKWKITEMNILGCCCKQQFFEEKNASR